MALGLSGQILITLALCLSWSMIDIGFCLPTLPRLLCLVHHNYYQWLTITTFFSFIKLFWKVWSRPHLRVEVHGMYGKVKLSCLTQMLVFVQLFLG
jgi:hypothetical protein